MSDLNLPLVSVVTVVFNDVKNIEKTIKSVLEQTYPKIEYIIIDGGSTDGTVEIIKKYADRLAYWVSEHDGGIYQGMNKGIARASGEWLNFMTSGDYFVDRDVFTKIFSEDHHGADFLYGSFIGNFNGRSVLCEAFNSVSDRIYQGMPLCQQALFARTSLMKASPFDLQYRVSADGEFVTKCAAAGRIFKRLDLVVFRVGFQGYSADHWLRARRENWLIARKYYPGLKTDWWHFSHLVRDGLFRAVKKITSWIGLYQLVRAIYRKKIQAKFPLLPKNSKPFVD